MKGVQINYSLSNGDKISQIVEHITTIEKAKQYVKELITSNDFIDAYPNPFDELLDAIIIRTSEIVSYSISLLDRKLL